MSTVDFDKYADEYNQLLNQQTGAFTDDLDYFAKYKVDMAVELLKAQSKDPKTILEFGCGIGRNIGLLKKAFPNAALTGSDVSQKSIDIARTNNPDINFIIENSSETPTEKYDFIFIVSVLGYVPIPNRQAVVDSLAARLNDGGSIIMFDQNPYNPVTVKMVRACPYGKEQILFSLPEIRKCFEKSGLKTAKSGYSLFFPPSGIFKKIAPLEKLLTWCPLGAQHFIHSIKA